MSSDTCKVYNKELFAGLTNGLSSPTQTNKLLKPRKKLTPKEKELVRAKLRYAQWIKMQSLKEKESDYRFQEKKQLQREIGKKKFADSMVKLKKGGKFVEEIDRFLTMQQQTDKQKKSKLYLDWHDEVFSQIQNGVANSLESMDSKTLKEMKFRQFTDFLKLSNRATGGMFLDSETPSGFAPQTPIMFPRVNTNNLNNPTRRVLQRLAEETLDTATSNKQVSIAKSRQRLVLDPRLWASGAIEATPYGHFESMMKEHPSQKDKLDILSPGESLVNSSLRFDHYNIEELPKPKKTNNHNKHKPIYSDAWKYVPDSTITQKIGFIDKTRKGEVSVMAKRGQQALQTALS